MEAAHRRAAEDSQRLGRTGDDAEVAPIFSCQSKGPHYGKGCSQKGSSDSDHGTGVNPKGNETAASRSKDRDINWIVNWSCPHLPEAAESLFGLGILEVALVYDEGRPALTDGEPDLLECAA